ncbi:MAG: hypothetical protein FWF92_03770 [Oscillospiraceae bacterium]|nr:hypothetical protein [Oscillospiraceae bacterium]
MYDPYNNPYEENKTPEIEVNFKRNRISTKKSGIGTVNAGGAIIIIIFVVLCLTIFGLLSFTTSFADKKLAERNLESVSQYYKADSEAEEALTKIFDAVYNKILSNSGSDGFFDENFVNSVVSGLSDISGEVEIIDVYTPYIEGLGSDEYLVAVYYRTNMGAGAVKNDKIEFYLSSEVNLIYNENTKKLSYKISEWKVMIESEFEYDNENLNVWDGMF